MAKNDQQEAFEKVLSANLARMTDWLKYAEAKNGALLAFVSAWTVAIANIIVRDPGPPVAIAEVIPVAACLFITAGLILLLSFVPRISLSRFFRRSGADTRPINYIFYGDIADQPITEFFAKITNRYLPAADESATEAYLRDLAVQIHVVGTIARSKFRMFKLAGWLSVAGVIVLVWPFGRSFIVSLW